VRATRLIAWILGAIAALVVVAMFIITQMVDANRFKPQIQRAVAEASGRELTIDGDLELDWFPWLSVRVGAASLANPAGFEGPSLLSVKQANIGARLFPLLDGRLELDRIRLDGLDVQLHRLADGRANWDGLGATAAEKPEQTASRWSLAGVGGLELRNSAITLTDDRDASRLVVSSLQADVDPWAPGQPVKWSAAAGVRSGTGKAAVQGVRISSITAWQGDTVTLTGTSLTLALRAAATAKDGLTVRAILPKIEADLARDLYALAPFSATLGDAADYRAELKIGAVQLSLAGETPQFDTVLNLDAKSLRALLVDAGVKAPITTDPKALGALGIDARIALANGGFSIEPLTLKLDDTTLRGRVTRAASTSVDASSAAQTTEFALQGDRMDIGRYLEPDDADTPPFKFPTAALQALQARGTIDLATATLGEAKMKGVTLRLVLDESGLRNQPPDQPLEKR
jgi:AsmA protein